MQTRSLSVYLGTKAAERIAEQGWNPDLFDLLVGASGGAKWLILGQLDRLLFGDFLQHRDRPLSTIGSSIGSWRNACFALPDPIAAIDRMQEGYLHQSYSGPKPSADEVGEVSRRILEQILGDDGAMHIAQHPRIHSHIVTARGRGASAAASGAMLGTGMGAAAISNIVSRKLLPLHFQRVVFHSGQTPQSKLQLSDFHTHYSSLDKHNTTHALMASGSIPFVLPGEKNIPGGPKGHYWDGGIIDYHFDLAQYRGDGLILYPHFSNQIIRGWFDKFLPWRGTTLSPLENLVLLCPSTEFISSLPQGKIPDRSDFKSMGQEERIRYWEECIERSRALAEEFSELVQGTNPLAGVTLLE
jgi:hypothetical protein